LPTSISFSVGNLLIYFITFPTRTQSEVTLVAGGTIPSLSNKLIFPLTLTFFGFGVSIVALNP